MKKGHSPNLGTFKEFFNEIIPYLKNKPILREIEHGPVLYVGDLHGFYQDLLNALEVARSRKVHSVIFLGDYADRGPQQLRTLLKVMDAYARSEGYNKFGILNNYIQEEKYPFKVFSLRGNHEDPEINMKYGFKEELLHKHGFPEFPLETLDILYSNLPLIATTRWKTIGIHGGIPKPREGQTVYIFPRYIMTKRTPLHLNSLELMIEVLQIQWNDPYYDNDQSKANFRDSFRGSNIYKFNGAALEDFLKANDYLRLVRAHQTTLNGYEIHWGNKLIHIFSTSPYFGQVTIAGYFLEFEDGSGEILNGSGNCLKKVDPPSN
jgi:hypothetical protein